MKIEEIEIMSERKKERKKTGNKEKKIMKIERTDE